MVKLVYSLNTITQFVITNVCTASHTEEPPHVISQINSYYKICYYGHHSIGNVYPCGNSLMNRHTNKKLIQDVVFCFAVAVGLGLLCYLLIKYQGTIWTFNSIVT